MIIIIDGYNLLKLVHDSGGSGNSHCSDSQRSGFISLMGKYIKKRNHKVLVVFDAGPTNYPSQERQKDVVLMYSGKYESADSVICTFVQHNSQKELVVITADRELIAHVTAYGAYVVESLLFYQKVRTITGADKKHTHVKNTHEPVVLKKFMQEDTCYSKENNQEEEQNYSVNTDLDMLMEQAAYMNMSQKEEHMVNNDRSKNKKLCIKQVSKSDRMRLKIWDKL